MAVRCACYRSAPNRRRVRARQQAKAAHAAEKRQLSIRRRFEDPAVCVQQNIRLQRHVRQRASFDLLQAPAMPKASYSGGPSARCASKRSCPVVARLRPAVPPVLSSHSLITFRPSTMLKAPPVHKHPRVERDTPVVRMTIVKRTSAAMVTKTGAGGGVAEERQASDVRPVHAVRGVRRR